MIFLYIFLNISSKERKIDQKIVGSCRTQISDKKREHILTYKDKY